MRFLEAESANRYERDCLIARAHEWVQLDPFLAHEEGNFIEVRNVPADYSSVRGLYKDISRTEPERLGPEYQNLSYRAAAVWVASLTEYIELTVEEEEDEGQIWMDGYAGTTDRVSGGPASIICGSYYSIMSAHARTTRSRFNVDEMDSDLLKFMARESSDFDLILFPYPMSLSYPMLLVGRLVFSQVVAEYEIGSSVAQEVPVHRPFLFLQTFTNRVWMLIVTTILAVGIVTGILFNINQAVRKRSRGHGFANIMYEGARAAFCFVAVFLATTQRRMLSYSRVMVGFWLLLCTVLSSCFMGSMRQRMAEAGAPAIVDSFDDFTRPEFKSWTVIVFDLSPERFYMYSKPKYRRLLADLRAEDRLTLMTYKDVREPLHVFITAVSLYLGGFIAAIMRRSVLHAFWQGLTFMLSHQIPFEYERLQSLHVSDSFMVEPLMLAFTRSHTPELLKGFNVVIGRLYSAGLLDLWVNENSKRLMEALPRRLPQVYTQLTVKELTGTFYLLFICIALSLTGFALEFLVWKAGRGKRKRQVNAVTIKVIDFDRDRKTKGGPLPLPPLRPPLPPPPPPPPPPIKKRSKRMNIFGSFESLRKRASSVV